MTEETAAKPWTMTFQGPEVVLPLTHKDEPIGTVRVMWNDASQAAVSTGDQYHAGGLVTFRGRRWQVFIHLYAMSGWTEDNGDPQTRFHLHQFQDADHYGKEAAPSFRAAIAAAITEAVTTFVTEHPDVLAAAQRSKLNRDLESAQEAEADAKAALAEAQTEVNRLENELDAL